MFEFSLSVLNFPVGLYFSIRSLSFNIFSSGLITEDLLHGIFPKDISRRKFLFFPKDFHEGFFQGEIEFFQRIFSIGKRYHSFQVIFPGGNWIFPKDFFPRGNCSFFRGVIFIFMSHFNKIPFLLYLCNHLHHHKSNTYKPNYRGHYPSYTVYYLYLDAAIYSMH